MATTPTPGQDPRTVVRTSTRLWSDEVGRANADEVVPPYDPAYSFGNREFVIKEHYMPANPLETP
jgi:hypothetical protein